MSSYQNLDAWKVAMQLVQEIYTITKLYPKEELYGLTSQTRRAAVSIPSNIAEGMGRNYKNDTIQFLYIARGSLYELETVLKIAINNRMIDDMSLNSLLPLIDKNQQVLKGLINYLEKSK